MAEVKKPVAVKKVEEKKVETVKKVAVKKAEPAKKAATTTTAAAKEAPAKKAASTKAAKEVVLVQFDDREVDLAGLIARAKDAYKAAGNTAAAKDVAVYVNVAEKMVYYVVDGFEGSFEA